MQNNIIETVLGAIVIAVTVFFLIFAYKITDLAPVEGYEITANFSRIDGLGVGNFVKISGVRVGKVTGFSLDKDSYDAIVTMNIEDGIKLPIDTAAIVASEGLLGGKYLALEVGGEDIYLKDGEQIEYTQSTPGLEQLLGQVIFSMSKKSEDQPDAATP